MIIKLDSASETQKLPAGGICVLGFFDGVHTGHRRLFEEAKKLGGHDIIAWTFSSLSKDGRGYLTLNDEKTALLGACGAAYEVLEDFDSVKDMDGETFFDSKIADALAPYAVVCGYNFRFGKGARCGTQELAEFAEKRGIKCVVVPEHYEDGISVSSSRIRSEILSGRVDAAAKLLGRLYSISGEVVHGQEIGRTIGYPTMNLRVPADKICPAMGVYACLVTFEGENGIYGGMCSYGTRPTVNDDPNDVTLETYIFGLSRDLYGKTASVHFFRMLRTNIKMTIDELIKQLDRDSEEAVRVLRSFPEPGGITYSGFVYNAEGKYITDTGNAVT